MTTPLPSAPGRPVPLFASVALAAAVAAASLFAVAFDQGQITSVVASGADSLLVHELFHDARHMLGFPCH